MNHDIVYILKNGYDSEEIRYSLRSVYANFPYRKVWTFGGKVPGIQPDELVEMKQAGDTKWDKVRNTLKVICSCEDITPSFWLFNDDFFVMKRVEELQPMVSGSIYARVQRIMADRDGKESLYSIQLKQTARILKASGYDRLDYALHVPMLIDRKKGLQTLNTFSSCPMFRSLYGNHHRIGGIITDDVKITALDIKPTGREILLSTNDESFRKGMVGEYIRAAFPDKCKYEL